MKEIRTILAATDFSDSAKAGVAWAIKLTHEHDAHLILVHALLLPNRMTDYVPSSPDLPEKLREAALARLDAAAAEVREQGVVVEAELPLGLPSQAILDTAEQRKADLIVVGTRGLTGLKHLFLGSTAERVVQGSTCPVLTIHPDGPAPSAHIRTILVPTDFSEDADRALDAAARVLSDTDDAQLLLLHAYHLPFEYTAYGTIPTSLESFAEVVTYAEERLNKLADKLRAEGFNVQTDAVEGYPPEVILNEAEKHNADLIAMGTHGRSGLAHLLLGSTAERVVQHAPCPVLTVPRLPR